MKQLDVCEKCSNIVECMAIIIDHSELIVKCIHFGYLRKCINSLEPPCESIALTPLPFQEECNK